jgi:hypothetical protein
LIGGAVADGTLIEQGLAMNGDLVGELDGSLIESLDITMDVTVDESTKETFNEIVEHIWATDEERQQQIEVESSWQHILKELLIFIKMALVIGFCLMAIFHYRKR